MSRAAAEAFCRDVAEAVPLLSVVLTKHIEYYEELLPHVFFGDVTRFAATCVQTGGDKEGLAKLLAVIEKGLDSGDSDIANVVAVSFVENLKATEDIRKTAGPELRQQIDDMEAWYASRSKAED